MTSFAAWQRQEPASLRPLISDGIYYRFKTQFTMMKLLDQQNKIDNLQIEGVKIDRVEHDGVFDIIHTAISASFVDHYISSRFPGLNHGGKERFVEYWSFIKRRGDDEQDWLLFEITQADDYASGSARLSEADKLPGFSVTMIEDRAGCCYLNVLNAIVRKRPDLMEPFVTAGAFSELKERIGEEQIVYNKFYLNDISLIGTLSDEGKEKVAVAVKATYQRVKVEGEKALLLDSLKMTKTEIVILTRGMSNENEAASIEDWIVDDIFEQKEYKNYLAGLKRVSCRSVKPELLDSLYSVRDYAFNNILLIMAADKIFGEAEQMLAEKIAKRWGYKVKQIQPLFELARNGRLSLRMPVEQKLAHRVYRLMEKAAMIDGVITGEERELLDEVKGKHLYF